MLNKEYYAKEMFEKLNYELKSKNGEYLDYQLKNKNIDSDHIVFELQEKAYYHEECDEAGITSIALHLAIHKQLKELGWLDE